MDEGKVARCALDPYGFRRALRMLGWEPACLVVAEAPFVRLAGMIPRSYGAAGAPGEEVVMGFPRCHAVHTCFMHRALDIAFLSKTGEVLAVHRAVEPWRMCSHRGAASVLERFSGL